MAPGVWFLVYHVHGRDVLSYRPKHRRIFYGRWEHSCNMCTTEMSFLIVKSIGESFMAGGSFPGSWFSWHYLVLFKPFVYPILEGTSGPLRRETFLLLQRALAFKLGLLPV